MQISVLVQPNVKSYSSKEIIPLANVIFDITGMIFPLSSYFGV